ncbi:MAG: hypothetical protein NTW73_02430, partial [Candidatus Parcubacteria bacterium]|nr:hypothetical protein [Candidatus Parcubacteria bacterium]
CASGTQIYSGTSTSYVHPGLNSTTSYSYRLCAYDKVGNVSSGATVTATTTAALSIGCTPTKPAYVSGETPSLTIKGSTSWGASSFVLKKNGAFVCLDQKTAGVPDSKTIIFGGDCMTSVANGYFGYGSFEASGTYASDPLWTCGFQYTATSTSFESDITSLKAQLLDLVRSLLEYIQNK